MNICEIGRRLVAIDSSAGHGNVEAAKALRDIAIAQGLRAEIFIENHLGVEQALLLIWPDKGAADQQLLFVGHLDTADPGEYFRWDKTGANPFHASVSGDKVFGLGAANSKFDFVAKLKALSDVKDRTFEHVRPMLLGTFEPESGAGAKKFLRRRLAKPIGALVAQPTGLAVADRGPGYAIIQISVPFSESEIRHRESHDLAENSNTQSKLFTHVNKLGLEPEFYDNPIVKLLEYLRHLPRGMALMSVEGGTSPSTAPDSALLELDLVDNFSESVIPKLMGIYEGLRQFNSEFKAIFDDGFNPPHSTFNVGLIRTKVEEIRITASCRLVPMVTKEIYDEWLGKLRLRCEASGAHFRVLDYKPPFFTSVKTQFSSTCHKLAEEMGLKSFVAAKTASDANVFSRFGIESLVYGAGQSVGHSHSANEHISLKDLETSLEFYRRAIELTCS